MVKCTLEGECAGTGGQGEISKHGAVKQSCCSGWERNIS
jgi:hypothetical protein